MRTIYYERRLPHWLPAGADFFVTTRLKDSLPREKRLLLEQEKLNLLQSAEGYAEALEKAHKKCFALYDSYLDKPKNGPYWLAEKSVAEAVVKELHRCAGTRYELHCFTILSNHIHLFLTPYPSAPPLFRLMQEIKRRSAKEANAILGRTGESFWQDESYDHFARKNGEFGRIVRYILLNSVKAGLVKDWMDWPYSYVSPACREMI